MSKFEIDSRASILTSLKDYCVLCDDNDYINVCEWGNGEGVDVSIYTSRNGEQMFSLTYGQLKALKKIAKYLQNET